MRQLAVKVSQLLLPGLLFVLAGMAHAHESPVDHVERELRLWVEDGRLHLNYRVQHSERSVLMQLHQMDANADGVISDAECESFFAKQAEKIAALLTLELDSQPLKFSPAGIVQRDARLGQTFAFTTPLANLRPGRHPGSLVDNFSRAYPGPFRWLRAGEGSAKGIRVEPVVQSKEQPTPLHPVWLSLKFEVVVPE